MAFEDRCSPNEANGPGPVNGRVPPPHCEYNNLIVMNENTKYGNQYTCTTINGSGQNWNGQDVVRRENVQPDLGLVKVQPVSPPPSPRSSPNGMVYPNCYQSQDVKPNLSNLQQKFKHIGDETRQESMDNLKFSISSILRPEFGINAIRLKAKTNKMEGPNPRGPNQSILYKPYDLSKVSKNTLQHVPKVAQQQHLKQKMNFEYEYLKNRAETPEIGLAPLGSLCQAVNQIGMPETSKPAQEKSFFSPNKAVEVQRRPDSASSAVSSTSSGPVSVTSADRASSEHKDANGQVWPAWVYCTRYSDRPSSGPRCKRSKKTNKTADEKRPRTAFSGAQLNRLKVEFTENRYLTERRRQQLASELGLAEAQIKIWFQNKRAKIKKTSGERNPLALQLMAQGLYNHATSNDSDDEMEEEIQVT